MNEIRLSAAALLFNPQNEILLMLRDDFPVWCLPGGYIDAGESFPDGLVREIFEETSLVISPDTLQLLGSFDKFDLNTKKTVLNTRLYLAKTDQITAQIGNEGLELRWFPLDQTPVNLLGIQYNMLEMYKNNAITSPDTVISIPVRGYQDHFEDLQPKQWTDFDHWNTHPKVVEKRRLGLLRYDPYPPKEYT